MKKSAVAVAVAVATTLVLFFSLYVKQRVTREVVQTYVPWTILKHFYSSNDNFTEYPLPELKTMWLYDYGVVDANDDDLLDVFTVNHNWRQSLLIADGKGGYRDNLSEWGLNQSRDFPELELSSTPPTVDKAGLYIYWLDEDFIIQAHDMGSLGGTIAAIHAFLEGAIPENSGFKVETTLSKTVTLENGIIDKYFKLSADKDAFMKLPQSPEYPVNVVLSDAIPLSQVFVGRKKVSPKSKDFVLALRDRHAIAWADYNGDKRLDLFITRGGMGGYLRKLPESIVQEVKDELLISQTAGEFKDLASELGIKKNACSGRQASWIDFNNDGLLDLFVNCQDRGRVSGGYPKQLYKQMANKKLLEVAKEAVLQVRDHFIATFKWLDVDNDGDIDLFAHQDNGFVLYRNHEGRFLPEPVYRRRFEMDDVPGLKYKVLPYWRYDGHMTVGDFDGDGDLDVFVSSKKGSALFVNEKGNLSFRDPGSFGLPRETVAASWTDFNSDGLLDLHAVPQGLFVQARDRKFHETNLLMLPLKRYMAAIVNWFDLDNDGSRDVSMALLKNPTVSRWWEFSPKEVNNWEVMTYRNIANNNHWLQVKLIGGSGNRQAIGSRVTIITPTGLQTQEVGGSDGAFFSQGHYRLYFGLGTNEKVDTLKVHWSDGHAQEFTNIKSDKLLTINRRNSSN